VPTQFISDSREGLGFLGGSDARTIVGTDEAALIEPWRERSEELQPADLSDVLMVQLGAVTEDLNRRWYGRNTGSAAAIDQASALLAHASGEWISSDWPVCPVSETAATHRLGADLTYARRYALFALVGVAGEDDLDASDLLPATSPTMKARVKGDRPTSQGSQNDTMRRPRQAKPQLGAEPSAALRDQLLQEINDLTDGDDLALWAHRRLMFPSA
jgi:hypothetical protein